MRTVYQILVLAFAILVAPAVKADTLDFTITGQGSTYTFSVDSSPTPDLDVAGVFFRLDNVLVNVDNMFGQTSNINFFNTFAAGGLSLVDLGNLALSGPQLYTGTEATPSFLTGQFTLMSGLDAYNLAITPESSPVPEPGGLVLLATGVVAALRSITRRNARSSSLRSLSNTP
jgi:hypothetical protein